MLLNNVSCSGLSGTIASLHVMYCTTCPVTRHFAFFATNSFPSRSRIRLYLQMFFWVIPVSSAAIDAETHLSDKYSRKILSCDGLILAWVEPSPLPGFLDKTDLSIPFLFPVHILDGLDHLRSPKPDIGSHLIAGQHSAPS